MSSRTASSLSWSHLESWPERTARLGAAAVAAADVVLCTCVGSGADSIAKHAYPAVLIDETAQSTEPSCLVPLCHGCRQLVLVGDHKQLRPTVVSDEAARNGLALSLFERMARLGIRHLDLGLQSTTSRLPA